MNFAQISDIEYLKTNIPTRQSARESPCRAYVTDESSLRLIGPARFTVFTSDPRGSPKRERVTKAADGNGEHGFSERIKIFCVSFFRSRQRVPVRARARRFLPRRLDSLFRGTSPIFVARLGNDRDIRDPLVASLRKKRE